MMSPHINRMVVYVSGKDFNFVIFSCTRQLSATTGGTFDWPIRPSSEQYLTDVGEPGETIVREILALEGIVRLTINRYEVTVTIGTAFENEKTKIAEQVLQIFERLIQPDAIEGATWRQDVTGLAATVA